MAEAAVSLSLAAGSAEPPHGVRVAIDGALRLDSAPLADAVAAAVANAGRPAARVSREDFLRPRSVRLELGADDPWAGWERWYDDSGLRREVLDPLGPGGSMTWLPALWDPALDRSVRAARLAAAPGTVLVVDGPYLLRPELADAVDLAVHLDVSPAALARRCDPTDLARVGGSWQQYVEQASPAGRATYLVRLEDPRHPALFTP